MQVKYGLQPPRVPTVAHGGTQTSPRSERTSTPNVFTVLREQQATLGPLLAGAVGPDVPTAYRPPLQGKSVPILERRAPPLPRQSEASQAPPRQSGTSLAPPRQSGTSTAPVETVEETRDLLLAAVQKLPTGLSPFETVEAMAKALSRVVHKVTQVPPPDRVDERTNSPQCPKGPRGPRKRRNRRRRRATQPTAEPARLSGLHPSVLEPEVIIQEGDQSLPLDTWATVTRRGRPTKRGQGDPQTAGPTARPESGNLPQSSSRRRAASQPRRRPLRTAAVTLTCVGDSVDTKTALSQARQKINLPGLGIEKISTRRARTGGLVIEVHGADGHAKADALAAEMRSVLEEHGDAVRVGRPTQMAELRLYGVEDSVTQAEVRDTVAMTTGCDPESVRVGPIRPTRGLATVWVRCPLIAANRLSQLGRVCLGWSSARVELLQPRGLQCFRCLQSGHTRLQCTALADRSTECYNCGETGHRARECRNPTRCSVCAALGREAGHRIGSRLCKAPVPAPRPAREVSQSQVERKSIATGEMDVDAQ
ncbi:uncharacterized protein LOC109863280 [Pseudomyrmex gracilis]|uniref:uncharacterized protein LOC109863280 n=1 Tax=Pseudomyrmex gracilis TaxID=219809 RepID=UPI000994F74F|nr:uncharacterized protein LOC109863280 [Pseudomyrmex gracilis]